MSSKLISLISFPVRAWRISSLLLRRTAFHSWRPIRRDPRGFCFRCATLTGALALLLMLGWQGYTAIAAADVEDAKPAVEPSQQAKGNSKSEAQAPPPVKPDSKTTVERAVSPFEDPPMSADVRQPKAPPSKTEITLPTFRLGDLPASPFGDPEPKTEQPQATKTVPVVNDPVRVEKPAPGTVFSSAQSAQPKTNVSAPASDRTKPPLLFGDETGDSKKSAQATGKSLPVSDAIDPAAQLGLELVRIPMPATRSADKSFLVASASASEGPRREAGVVGGVLRALQGWSLVQTAKDDKTILPAGHRNVASTGSTLTDVTLSSSAAGRWEIIAPKLDVTMKSYPVDDNRVRIEVRITNTGTAVADNVRLHIDLPAELTYRVGRNLLHRAGPLKPGRTHTVRLTATVIRPGKAAVRVKAVGGATPAIATLTIGEIRR